MDYKERPLLGVSIQGIAATCSYSLMWQPLQCGSPLNVAAPLMGHPLM